MLYPAELGARRSAIQVIGARPVKLNSARPLCSAISRPIERSAGEVEAAHPGCLATLDRAARNFTQ